MQPLGDALYHLRLLGLMGKTTGSDLTTAFSEGLISSEDWAFMINRCRACSCTVTCERWLGAHENAELPPECCNNSGVLKSLRAEMEQTKARVQGAN